MDEKRSAQQWRDRLVLTAFLRYNSSDLSAEVAVLKPAFAHGIVLQPVTSLSTIITVRLLFFVLFIF